jgi:hypothetical protein
VTALLRAMEALGVRAFPSATVGLLHLVDSLKPKRLFVPAVHCAHVVRALRGRGVPITFVELDGWAWMLGAVDWSDGLAVLTHLWGVKSPPPPPSRKLIVVEDCAHSASNLVKADYHLFSTGPGKVMSLQGGGFLVSSLPPPSEPQPATWVNGYWRVPGLCREATSHIVIDAPRAQSVRERLWSKGFDTFVGFSGFTRYARSLMARTVVLPLLQSKPVSFHESRVKELLKCL